MVDDRAGVGAVVALTYATAIVAPERFARSRRCRRAFRADAAQVRFREIDTEWADQQERRFTWCAKLCSRRALSLITRTQRWSAQKAWGKALAKRARPEARHRRRRPQAGRAPASAVMTAPTSADPRRPPLRADRSRPHWFRRRAERCPPAGRGWGRLRIKSPAPSGSAGRVRDKDCSARTVGPYREAALRLPRREA